MIVHSTPQFTIYFGDAQDQMYRSEYLQWNDTSLRNRIPITPIIERLHIEELFFLRQVHGKNGSIVSASQLPSRRAFSEEGDFLITADAQLGIGIMTADCLPVIAYDRKRHVIGIAHAGWRGAIAGVVPALIEMLKKNYNTEQNDLFFLFGPSAKRCCYEVSPSFSNYLEEYSFADQTLQLVGDTHFFDLPLFVKLQLHQGGVSQNAFCGEYNACTICETCFHSSRRTRKQDPTQESGRQMTVVALK